MRDFGRPLPSGSSSCSPSSASSKNKCPALHCAILGTDVRFVGVTMPMRLAHLLAFAHMHAIVIFFRSVFLSPEGRVVVAPPSLRERSCFGASVSQPVVPVEWVRKCLLGREMNRKERGPKSGHTSNRVLGQKTAVPEGTAQPLRCCVGERTSQNAPVGKFIGRPSAGAS